MSRLPMETAPRTVTSCSGNSRRAASEAEYTDAPLSLTMTTGIPRERPRMKASVSLPAVPLPTAMTSTAYRETRSFTVLAASEAFPPAKPGKITS
jgi:hypothetical protein